MAVSSGHRMPPKYKFAENEKVLCYHGPLLYEAKVSNFLLSRQERLYASKEWKAGIN